LCKSAHFGHEAGKLSAGFRGAGVCYLRSAGTDGSGTRNLLLFAMPALSVTDAGRMKDRILSSRRT